MIFLEYIGSRASLSAETENKAVKSAFRLGVKAP